MVNNMEICKVEMENFLLENKIANIANYDEEWEPFVKRIKESDFNRLDKFETKLVQYFQVVVKVYLPRDVL